MSEHKRLFPLGMLLEQAGLPPANTGALTPIAGLTADSRAIKPGWLFVAVGGGSVDGHRFIDDAIRRGAAAVVGQQTMAGLQAPYARVANSRKALARLAAAFHGFPSAKMTVIGVTGTDGKTTTATLLYNMLRTAGLQAGMISTVSAVIGDEALDTGFHVTTPDAPEVQRYLFMMAEAGISHVVLEATSHGLAQGRVEECAFDAALVTNITHEHLDYHGSFEAYRAAKGRLFAMLAETPPKVHGNLRAAVLNADDPSLEYLRGLCPGAVYTYAVQNPQANVVARDLHSTPDGLQFTLLGPGYDQALRSPLIGEYNVYNILAAATMARHVLGLPLDAIAGAVAHMSGIKGRMQNIVMGQDFQAIVDFAHTPNALSKALTSARRLATGRLITVFGSAGLRDREKRYLMSETAARLADLSVLTAEDPRTENLDAILEAMAQGARGGGGVEGISFVRIPDRAAAIRYAINLARPGDIVIVCGKGHEQSMCFGEIEYPWDDQTAVRAALAERLGENGPAMPYLPTQEPGYGQD